MYGSVEIGNASLTILNGGNHVFRVESIARLTFDYVVELMEKEMRHLTAARSIDGVQVPPIEVNLDSMTDDAIARAGAEAICRALMAVI